VRMPWGRYRGYDLAAVPGSYLVWVLETLDDVDDSLRAAIRQELALRFDLHKAWPPPPPPPSPCRRCLEVSERWPTMYRRLAAACHPDHGGSASAMKLINELNDLLRS